MFNPLFERKAIEYYLIVKFHFSHQKILTSIQKLLFLIKSLKDIKCPHIYALVDYCLKLY